MLISDEASHDVVAAIESQDEMTELMDQIVRAADRRQKRGPILAVLHFYWESYRFWMTRQSIYIKVMMTRWWIDGWRIEKAAEKFTAAITKKWVLLRHVHSF